MAKIEIDLQPDERERIERIAAPFGLGVEDWAGALVRSVLALPHQRAGVEVSRSGPGRSPWRSRRSRSEHRRNWLDDKVAAQYFPFPLEGLKPARTLAENRFSSVSDLSTKPRIAS